MGYSPLLVRPMREELTSIGFTELLTATAVDEWMAQKSGTALLAVNFVDGASAGFLRPALAKVLQRSIPKPDRLATVFAVQDEQATAQARSYFADVPASEPSAALFQEGELVWFLPRHRITARDSDQIADDLQAAFAEYCGQPSS